MPSTMLNKTKKWLIYSSHVFKIMNFEFSQISNCHEFSWIPKKCFWNITGYAIDPPCCVPTEFDDLSMLTVTKKQFITKNPTNSDLLLKQHLMNQNQSDAEEEVTLLRIYQSMIATKCGCKWAVHHIISLRNTKFIFFRIFRSDCLDEKINNKI